MKELGNISNVLFERYAKYHRLSVCNRIQIVVFSLKEVHRVVFNSLSDEESSTWQTYSASLLGKPTQQTYSANLLGKPTRQTTQQTTQQTNSADREGLSKEDTTYKFI